MFVFENTFLRLDETFTTNIYVAVGGFVDEISNKIRKNVNDEFLPPSGDKFIQKF